MSLRDPAIRRRAPKRLIVHVSNSDIGGAEASLISEIAAEAAGAEAMAAIPARVELRGYPPTFLIAAEGPLSRAISDARMGDGLAALAQGILRI